MRLPKWFWIGMGIWLVLGLPGYIVGALWNGGFDPIIDAPPYFQTPFEDRSLSANAIWSLAAIVTHLPLLLVPAAWLSVRRRRKTPNA